MITKKSLIEENKKLRKELEKQHEEICYLNSKLNSPVCSVNDDTNLNMKYLLLSTKYNKLLNSCLSKET